MKSKTIKAILTKKFNEFAESIEDQNVRKLVKSNTIITGGSIANLLLGEPVNDFDMYFTNKDTASAVAKYYVEKFKKTKNPQFKNGSDIDIRVDDSGDRVKIVVKSAGVASESSDNAYQYFETSDPEMMEADQYVETAMKVAESAEDDGERYRPVFLSANAITLSHKVQLVLRFFGPAEEIHKNYDFVHCTNYWESGTGKLTLHPEALECLLAKELRYVGSLYPICSVIRLRKFIKRGFTINAGQILKMAMQISQLDLTDVKVLEDQLIGVDVAYFNEVVSKLKEKDATRVDYAYLMEIIDRMF